MIVEQVALSRTAMKEDNMKKRSPTSITAEGGVW